MTYLILAGVYPREGCMFRKLVLGLLVSLLFTPLLLPQSQQYNTSVSATSTNTAVTFGFNATSLVLKNDGANSVFLDFSDTVAETTNFELKNGETLALSVERSENGWPGFGAICSAAETATVRVLAVRGI